MASLAMASLFAAIVAELKMPLRQAMTMPWSTRAQYSATNSTIAPIGSSPDTAFARSFTPQVCPSFWMRAMSLSLVILLIVSEPLSLNTCRSAVRSFQNGISMVRPPPAARASNSGARSMMPLCTNALSSAVRSIAYRSNTSGTMMSANMVFAITQSFLSAPCGYAAAFRRAANAGSVLISFICSVRFHVSLRNGFFTVRLFPLPPPAGVPAAPPPALDSNR